MIKPPKIDQAKYYRRNQVKLKKKILIFGAGAIGRGFIAPLFYKYNYDINFADIDSKLIKKLKKRKFYQSCIIRKKKYSFQKTF